MWLLRALSLYCLWSGWEGRKRIAIYIWMVCTCVFVLYVCVSSNETTTTLLFSCNSVRISPLLLFPQSNQHPLFFLSNWSFSLKSRPSPLSTTLLPLFPTTVASKLSILVQITECRSNTSLPCTFKQAYTSYIYIYLSLKFTHSLYT